MAPEAGKRKLKVLNPEDTPVKIIASAIIDISNAVKEFRNGRLNEKAILILLANASGQSQHTVKTVLNALEDLSKLYTRK